jgi:DNA-binding response OmpR family regulator
MQAEESTGGVVLYVEDDRLNVTLVEEIVALVPGAVLHVEATVAGAIRRLRTGAPAIVLVDLDLPDGSGLDVVAAATGVDPRPRVLVVTGDVAERTAALAVERGADGVLVKPYRVAELLAAITTAVGG